MQRLLKFHATGHLALYIIMAPLFVEPESPFSIMGKQVTTSPSPHRLPFYLRFRIQAPNFTRVTIPQIAVEPEGVAPRSDETTPQSLKPDIVATAPKSDGTPKSDDRTLRRSPRTARGAIVYAHIDPEVSLIN